MRILGFILLLLVAVGLAGVWRTARDSRRGEARYPPEGEFVAVKGGRIHLVDTGPRDAPPERTLVLLHGASGNLRDMMLALGDQLKLRYRIVAPDRPGHGWSDRPDGRADSSPALQADLISEALGKIGIGKAIIVGHSWSGALATNLALDHADHVAGLVLLSPATHPWPGGVTWYFGAAVAPVFGTIFAHVLVAPIAGLSIDEAITAVFAPQAAPQDYGKIIGARLLLRPANFRANAEDVYDLLSFVENQSTRYSDIKVPTTIIAGDVDNVVSTDIHSRALAQQIAGAKLIILPGMGHMPHHTAKDVVIAEIDAISAKLGGPHS